MEQLLRTFKKPVLIVSTKVGRGMYTMGDALKEAFGKSSGQIDNEWHDYVRGNY